MGRHAPSAPGASPPRPDRRRIPGQLAAVVDRPVEVELLPQLDLPLAEHGLGREYQDAPGTPGEPCLTQQHARLDGLTEPHLVRDQEPRRPVAVQALERPCLMRPRLDRRGRLADPLAAARTRRRLPNEPPEPAPQDTRGRRRGCRGRSRRGRGIAKRLPRGFAGRLRLKARRPVRCRQEAHQVPARRLRDVHHDHALRLPRPDPREARLLLVDPSGLGSPARGDADALPVAPPAGARLVQASGPCEPVADPILDDPGLLMEDGVLRDRRAARVAGHGDLHFQESARDHPCQQFQRAGRGRIGRVERKTGQAPFDEAAELLAPLDRLDLRRLQGAADDEPHAAVVSHQTFDAARRERQGTRVEIPRQPVVALRVLERRHIEPPDEIAVLGGVLEAPCAIPQHGQGLSARQSRSCSGSSTCLLKARRLRL